MCDEDARIPPYLPPLLALCSSFVRGVTGFGDGVTFQALWAIFAAFGFLPACALRHAVLYSTLCQCVTMPVQLWLARRSLPMIAGYALPMILVGVVGVILGARILLSLTSDASHAAQAWLGGLFLAFGVWQLSLHALREARRRRASLLPAAAAAAADAPATAGVDASLAASALALADVRTVVSIELPASASSGRGIAGRSIASARSSVLTGESAEPEPPRDVAPHASERESDYAPTVGADERASGADRGAALAEAVANADESEGEREAEQHESASLLRSEGPVAPADEVVAEGRKARGGVPCSGSAAAAAASSSSERAALPRADASPSAASAAALPALPLHRRAAVCLGAAYPRLSANASPPLMLALLTLGAAAGGFIGGVSGAGGPPLIAVYSLLELDKALLLGFGTVPSCFMLVRLVLYASAPGSVFDLARDWPLYLALPLAAIAGSLLGHRVRARLDARALLAAIQGIVALSGGVMLGAFRSGAAPLGAFLASVALWAGALAALIAWPALLLPQRCAGSRAPAAPQPVIAAGAPSLTPR